METLLLILTVVLLIVAIFYAGNFDDCPKSKSGRHSYKYSRDNGGKYTCRNCPDSYSLYDDEM